MDYNHPKLPALQADWIDFDLDNNYDDNCLEQWAIDSDEIGNLVICRDALADSLRADWD